MAIPGLGPWQLNIRIDRPVEGCLITPHLYLFQKGEKGPQTQVKHVYTHRWLRGPERPVCANPDCPRVQSFNPLQWSKFARKGCSFSIQCVCCAKLRIPKHKSVFCTLECFQDAWQSHRSENHASERSRKLTENNDPADAEDDTPPPPSIDYLTADTNAEDWVEVSVDKVYTPQPSDIGRCLKLEVRVWHEGHLFYGPRLIETEPVLSAPPAPPLREVIGTKNVNTPGLRFRIATYNVLAEIYATQQMYPYCDHWALSWNYRKINLLREMKNVQADVYFLQEVQADHYERHLLPQMSEEGFEGLYKHKTRESMGASGKIDGCALLWRRSKFRLADKYVIEFNDLARKQAREIGLSYDQQQAFLQRVLKDNIAQAVILEVVGGPARGRRGANLVCMANTHLYSHPEFPDVKVWQCHQLLQWLEGIVLPASLPLILCGDFNSEPTSAVYELVSQQMLENNHPDLQSDSTDLIRSVLLSEHPQIGHNLALKSAYAALREEPKFTNYTVGYTGVLDYIWFSALHWRPLGAAQVPSEQELTREGEALPNALYPSDHLILFADMQFVTGGPGMGAGGALAGMDGGVRKGMGMSFGGVGPGKKGR